MSGCKLSSALSSFVGRDAEIAHLLELCSTTRVLTLVGPGGIGKSFLAQHLSALIEDAFNDGAWSMDVDALGRPGELARAIGELRLNKVPPDGDWWETLAEWFGQRRVLLLLDNCDRRITECADLAAYLLRNCPRIQLVATSREPLAIDGELVWRVPPFNQPPPDANGVREVEATDAAHFFISQLEQHQPGVSLDENNSRAVAAICQRAHGSPLVLEIVAANVPRLGLDKLGLRLDASFAMRLSNAGAAPARMQSLRATLDWTYALLSESERILLTRLSVFVGGWTLGDAEAVCADARLPLSRVAELIDRLASKSLVSIDHGFDGARYQFVDFVRVYAAELLRASGDELAVRRRHANNVLRIAAETPPARLAAAHATRMELDQGNLRAALRWAVHARDVDLAFDLAIAGYEFWYRRARFAEGLAWLRRCLALPVGDETQALRRALIGCFAGHLAMLRGQADSARALLEAARGVHIELGNREGLALAALCLAELELWQGNPRAARTSTEEATAAIQHLGGEGDVAEFFQSALLTIRSRIAGELGDDRQAASLAASAANIARARRSQFWLGRALHAQGLAAEHAGQVATALWLIERAVGMQRSDHDAVGLVESLCALGKLRFTSGSETEGLSAFAEAADVAERTGQRIGLERALEGAARGLSPSKPEVAVRLAAPWELTRTGAVRVLHDLAVRQTIPQQLHSERLTRRERDIVGLVATGLTNKQIAARLTISIGTVRSHVDHVLSKLGLHSRAQVAVWALARRERFV